MRLIVVGVAWVLGISFARHFNEIDLSAWLLYSAAVFAITFVCRKHRLRWFPVALVVFGFGALRQQFVPQSSNIAQYNDYNGTVTGLVLEEPVMSDDHIQLRLEAESMFVNGITVETSGLVMVKGSSSTSVAYGDRVRITGRLATPESWDTFSYADYLGRQGVFAIMRNAAIEVISSGHGSWLVSGLYNFKHAVHRQINRALPEPQAGLLAGIVLGNEAGISSELEDDFRRVGATHIIAISGFNMVVISAIVIRMAGGLFGGKKTLATVSAISIILVYSFMVGASAGIMRAALMSSLLVIGEQLKRNTFVPTSLALATLLLTLIDPNVLLDIGFQLSFCAVLGLGLFADPLSPAVTRFLATTPARIQSTLAAQYAQRTVDRFSRRSNLDLAIDRALLWTIVVGCLAGQFTYRSCTVGNSYTCNDSGIRKFPRANCRNRTVLGGYGFLVLVDCGNTRLRATGIRRPGAQCRWSCDTGILCVHDRGCNHGSFASAHFGPVGWATSFQTRFSIAAVRRGHCVNSPFRHVFQP